MLTLKIKKEIRSFIKAAGNEALKSQKSLDISAKEDGVDVVTHIDKKIEKDFHKLVSKLTPGYGFFGEEFQELRKKSEYTWTIDPIDGTKYYAKQIPLWTISISLLKDNEPVFGLIYYPMMDQLFEAELGKGAILNGILIKVRRYTDNSKLMLSWDCPSLNKFDESTRDQVLKELVAYEKEYYRVRKFGAATLSICWILTGLLGTFIKYEASEKESLDDYAGIIIAKEAGCKVNIEKRKIFSVLEITI